METADFSLDALEFPSLRRLLGRYVQGPLALRKLEELGPTTDRDRLEREHRINREAGQYLGVSNVSFTDIALLPEILDRLNTVRATLEIQEVEAVQQFLSQVRMLRKRWKGDQKTFPLLSEKANRLPDLEPLATLLGRALRAGDINEDYSPQLKRVRRESDGLRKRLNRKLESLIKDPDVAEHLQESLVTMRNGRYVVPVRIDQKRGVPGFVHGTSSSGATVFVEPVDTLEMNNDLVRLREEEEREIQRVLAELSDAISDSATDLGRAANLHAEFEVLFGLARFGRDFDCTAPEFSDGELCLVHARHPLLVDRLRSVGEAMVPLELEIDPKDRILVISGPNAGGKTVVLKTIGLISLMAQSGIPVPAERAVVGFADRILADIGDHQSIANQLSTFSAHVLSLSGMVRSATLDSLILIDEIGSSTEPAEGAALGVAVLEEFRNVGARTIATTHYNRLKMYAETTPGVGNAAMEFDESTLEPTFRIIPGLAGQSSGLKIAERLGLPEPIVERARSAMGSGEQEAERYVEELKQRVGDLEREKEDLEAEKNRFEQWKEKTARQIQTDRHKEIERVEQRLQKAVAEIRERASRELRSLGSEAVNRFDKRLKRARSEAAAELRRTPATQAPAGTKSTRPSRAPDGESPPEGTRVRVASLGIEGVITRQLGVEVEVQAGAMKVRRPIDDIERIDRPPPRLPENVTFDYSTKQLESNEIHLIGKSADEAREDLDKFLDDAQLSRLPMVRIIHGHGQGILRRMVAQLLESHPHVDRFEAAPPSQGGTGATLAYLRD